MGDIIPIIVTGGGAPGISGTLYALKNNPDGVKFAIITTDILDDVPGKYLSDAFYKLQEPESDGYLSELQEIIEREQVKVILPQTTREITLLSKHTDTLRDSGIGVVVSSRESIRIANDKYLLLEKAKSAGIPCPKYVLTHSENSLLNAIKSLGYPEKNVTVKPRVSSGMRGLRIITAEPWDVESFLSKKPEGTEICLDTLLDILHRGEWPELLVTEYLPGPEYTIDVFRGTGGRVVIPRLREKIRSGITFETRVDLRGDLIEFSSKLADILDLIYCFGFQWKLSPDGVPRLLECNPRVQGTMVVSVFAGCNMIYYAVMEALEKPVKVNKVQLKNDITFKRYWGGIAGDENGYIGTI